MKCYSKPKESIEDLILLVEENNRNSLKHRHLLTCQLARQREMIFSLKNDISMLQKCSCCSPRRGFHSF